MMPFRSHFILLFLLFMMGTAAAAPAPVDLKVSSNRRHLVTGDQKPFFYLGDTAWELFHRLNRAEADKYLSHRARQGYTVIQAVALAELDGLQSPSAAGHLPLMDLDPARPAVVEGPDNDYWDDVDYMVRRANELGLVVALLPTWGDKWNSKSGSPVFNPANAETYGKWLGERYRDAAVIWVLGGDRTIDSPAHAETITAMARGLHEGDGGKHLRTFHPPGGRGSSEWFHDAPWLDFHMRQNGHVASWNENPSQPRGYIQTLLDYRRENPKPVLDAEPLYEDHPLNFNSAVFGHSIAADVRRPLYWNLFSGACGHTYGHHSVWQMASPAHPPINQPLLTWYQALEQPGAEQMQYGRKLMESRNWPDFVPDPELLMPASAPTSIPGAGRYYFAATRSSTGSCAMVYAPVGRAFQVRLERISGAHVRAWWFNPRDGSHRPAGLWPTTASQLFTPPSPGEDEDWVLVLDDASLSIPPPGQ